MLLFKADELFTAKRKLLFTEKKHFFYDCFTWFGFHFYGDSFLFFWFDWHLACFHFLHRNNFSIVFYLWKKVKNVSIWILTQSKISCQPKLDFGLQQQLLGKLFLIERPNFDSEFCFGFGIVFVLSWIQRRCRRRRCCRCCRRRRCRCRRRRQCCMFSWLHSKHTRAHPSARTTNYLG